MLSLVLAISCAAMPTPAELAAGWRDFAAHSQRYVKIAPPSPTDVDWQRLASGAAVTRRFRTDDGSGNRALAMQFVDQPAASVWLAILDGKHAGMPPEYSEWTLAASATAKTLYQHLTLPFPVTNRHWILVAASNGELYAHSGKTAWERSWELDWRQEAALADLPATVREANAGAIWTPKNRGGWLLLSVGWGTLAIYQLEVDIGGWIPEELVSRWALSTLKSLVTKTMQLAEREAVHYVAGHAPIYAPDGLAIAPY